MGKYECVTVRSDKLDEGSAIIMRLMMDDENGALASD